MLMILQMEEETTLNIERVNKRKAKKVTVSVYGPQIFNYSEWELTSLSLVIILRTRLLCS